MLSIQQTAKLNYLQNNCFLHHKARQSVLVAINESTGENPHCSPLPDTGKLTESYVRWVLELPLHMPLNEQRLLANNVAKLICTQLKMITDQRARIIPD